MRKLVVATAVALIIPAAASAHVTIQPSFVEDGVETEISFQTPNERPPNETISLSVKAPPGISIDSASSPPGWNADVSGSSVTWTGGRLVDRTTTAFPVRDHCEGSRRDLQLRGHPGVQRQRQGEVERRPDRAPGVRRSSAEGAPVGRHRRGRRRRPVDASSASTSSGGAHFQRDSGTGCYRRIVIFHQFLNGDLGCACYLVGDEEAGIAVLVDPPFAIEPLLEEAERRGLRIVRTIETHTHADHVSGHGRLALEHGIPISIHPLAEVDYPNDPMVDGDAIEVGAVTLGVIHTPGPPPRALLPDRDRHVARR